MDRTPSYHRPGKRQPNHLFFRNYCCPHYDLCLDKAAREDLFLDCTYCDYRDNASDRFLLGTLKF